MVVIFLMTTLPFFDLLPLQDHQGADGLAAIDSLAGGSFGAAVVDLSTGAVLVSTGSGQYPVDGPAVFLLAYAVDCFDESGDPSGWNSGDTAFASRILREFQEDPEYTGGNLTSEDIGRIGDWIETGGFCDTEFGDPPSGRVFSSVEDVTSALLLVHSGRDIPAVSTVMSHPDLGAGQAASVGEGHALSGLVDSGDHHRTFMLIAEASSGRELGLVLLNRDLCCPGKGDLALMFLWNVAAGL